MNLYFSWQLILICFTTGTVIGCLEEPADTLVRLVEPGTSYNVISTGNGYNNKISMASNESILDAMFLMKLYYRCQSDEKRLTLKSTLHDGTEFLLSSSMAPYSSLQPLSINTINEKTMHTYTLGSDAHYMQLETSSAGKLQPSGDDVMYSSAAFSWSLMPIPIFSGKNLSQISHEMGANKRMLHNTVDNKIQVILGSQAAQRGIQANQFNFEVYRFRLYTGFDSTSKFKWVKSVVIRKEGSDWYLAPDADSRNGVIPLCEKFRFKNTCNCKSKTILYQRLHLRKFNDITESVNSQLRTASISDAKRADRRWFQIEPQGNGRARLRPAFDLGKYVAVLKRTDDDHLLVITTYRSDAERYLSYEFDLKFNGTSGPLTDDREFTVRRKPGYPCNRRSRCTIPGEVEDTELRPKIQISNTESPNLHPKCYDAKWLNYHGA